ncbi:PIN domain-containing protein [Pontiella sp.]|uniref:PIN domain-containing protein n=1 Tax=Pontiella sp. TaxID=2837462 RepID=UPI003565A05E
MNAEVFLDTNIVVYAFDKGDPARQDCAKRSIGTLVERNARVAVSIQVLQEFMNTMLRKGESHRFLREVVEHFLQRDVIENTGDLLRRAIDVQERFQLSFYDANIIAAAQVSGAKEIWSEEFNTGQDYGGVVAVNPFEKL